MRIPVTVLKFAWFSQIVMGLQFLQSQTMIPWRRVACEQSSCGRQAGTSRRRGNRDQQGECESAHYDSERLLDGRAGP